MENDTQPLVPAGSDVRAERLEFFEHGSEGKRERAVRPVESL